VTYEIALLGATGFTGGLTAEYLADHAPGDLRWAVAGRNRARLDELARRLSARSPDREPVGVIPADMTDLQSLTSLASSARVVATTAGPFAASAGTKMYFPFRWSMRLAVCTCWTR